MIQQPDEPQPAAGADPEPEKGAAPPILAEDLLLLLFQPESGTIAGENTLYYVLAGAILADLGLGGHVGTTTERGGGTLVEAVEDRPPADRLLRAGWEHVAEKPRGVQAVLAAIGPTLRAPLLDRLAERGDVRREKRKMLGLFDTTALVDGGSGRREDLLMQLRAVLVDGAEPTPRAASIAALIYGSGTLPQFDRDIPWTSSVIARAEELKKGDWGAGAAAEAVARTVTATIVNNVIIAAAVLPR